MPTFLRLVRCDNEVPLLLTLCDEHGNEIDRDTTPSDEAIRCAIMLLARSKALRPGYRLTVSMESDGARVRGYGLPLTTTRVDLDAPGYPVCKRLAHSGTS